MNVVVNGKSWEIIYVKPNDKNLVNSKGIYVLGVTDGNTRKVYINNRLNDYMADKVLSHELCHVFCFSYGIWLDMETEELIADFLATYGREIFNIADSVLCRFAKIC